MLPEIYQATLVNFGYDAVAVYAEQSDIDRIGAEYPRSFFG